MGYKYFIYDRKHQIIVDYFKTFGEIPDKYKNGRYAICDF